MKTLKRAVHLFVFLFIGILFCQFSSSQDNDFSRQVLGKWKYEKHIYHKVGRYGKEEVDAIKSSLLYFMKDKVYFTDLTFIDTCFYTQIQPKAFFDRQDKEVSYFQDGPLSIKYSDKQLSNFTRIDLNSPRNHFGVFYLNADTLILNSSGGVTFFFTKNKTEQ